MNRDISQWSGKKFDIVIIGGGIYGAAIAWESTLRGFRVALVERGDYGWATSSNSAKIAHCGMRYLQHANFKRMRESVHERTNLVKNAPHLVDSLPFIMPVYGHGIKGRETVTAYLKTYDLFSARNRQFSDPARQIAKSGMLPREDVSDVMPGVNMQGLTGAGIWYEGQMHNTERLLLAFLESASRQGLSAANYVDATRIIHNRDKVVGLEIVDRVTSQSVEVETDVVINATGPWIAKTLSANGLAANDYGIYTSKAFSLLTRSFTDSVAFTFPIKQMYLDKKAVFDKGSSMQFAIPWRDSTMVASLHLGCEDEDPDNIVITDEEVDLYLQLINEGYPAAKLSRDDVRNVLWGIIPAEEKGSAAPLKHYKIIDHRKLDNLQGLISVVGVKYTTARDVAEKTINLASEQLKEKPTISTSKDEALAGGNIPRLAEFTSKAIKEFAPKFGEELVRRLVRNYGNELAEVLALADQNSELGEIVGDTGILKAEIVYAVRNESALSLSDVVLRRTEMGSLEQPGDTDLQTTAGIMAQELGWSAETTEAMIDGVIGYYKDRLKILGETGLPLK